MWFLIRRRMNVPDGARLMWVWAEQDCNGNWTEFARPVD